jgi:hypothetical protein
MTKSYCLLDSGDYDTQEYDYTTSKLSEIKVYQAKQELKMHHKLGSDTGVQTCCDEIE